MQVKKELNLFVRYILSKDRSKALVNLFGKGGIPIIVKSLTITNI